MKSRPLRVRRMISAHPDRVSFTAPQSDSLVAIDKANPMSPFATPSDFLPDGFSKQTWSTPKKDTAFSRNFANTVFTRTRTVSTKIVVGAVFHIFLRTHVRPGKSTAVKTVLEENDCSKDRRRKRCKNNEKTNLKTATQYYR